MGIVSQSGVVLGKTATISGTVTQDNFLVVFAGSGATDFTSVTSGWTEALKLLNGAPANDVVAIYYRKLTANESNPSFSITTSDSENVVAMFEFEGGPGNEGTLDIAFNEGVSADGEATLSIGETAATDTNDEVVFAFGYKRNTGGVASFPATSTALVNSTTSAKTWFCCFDVLANTGTQTRIVTLTNGGGTGISGIVTFRAPIPTGKACVSTHTLISPIDGLSQVDTKRAAADTLITTGANVLYAEGYGWAGSEYAVRTFDGAQNAVNDTDELAGFETNVGVISSPIDTTGKFIYTNMYTGTPRTLQNTPLSSAGTGFMLMLSSNEPPNTHFRLWSLGGRGPNPPLTAHTPLTMIIVDPSYTTSAVDAATHITHRSAGTFDPTNLRNVSFLFRGEDNVSGTDYDRYWLVSNRLGMYGAYRILRGAVGDEATLVLAKNQCASEKHFAISTLISGGYLSYAPLIVGDASDPTPTVSKIENETLQFGRSELDGTTNDVRNLHAAPNSIGLEYDVQAGDTHLISGAIIKCETSYYLELNGAVGADCDMVNTLVQNAGSVADLINIESDWVVDSCTFKSCGKIDINGATLQNSSIANPGNGSGCIIDTTAVLNNVAFTTETATDYAIEVDTAGSYDFTKVTFSGFTKDLNITATSGTVTINILGGGDSPTYDTAGATVVLDQSVNIEFSGIVEGSVLAVYRVSDGSAVIAPTTVGATGNYSTSYAYTGDEGINVFVRKATTSPKYEPYKASGVISSTGFSLIVSQIEDTINA